MKRAVLIALIMAPALLGWGYAGILADPIERRATIRFADWPEGARPIRIALLADIHVQGPDMPPERVARIVRSINASHPDLIVLAGDFVGDRIIRTRLYSSAEIAAALGGLSARLGVYAVLGNHDHWRNGPEVAAALRQASISLIDNRAVRVGPVLLVGLGDAHTRHAWLPAVRPAIMATDRPVVVLSHSPDVIPELPARAGLVLAGHTHCGQIVLPVFGAPVSASRFGERYRCGVIREGGRAIIVSAGLGASVLPLRYGAPPDWWIITVGPGTRR